MDAAAIEMQNRVRFIGRDDWTDLQAGHRAIVTIRTRGGGTLTEAVRHRPMDAAELDRWADWAKGCAERGDVFVYFISGAKPRAPAAAMALIERL